MGMLVNIDNGGTLTDICVIKDNNFYKTKTLTTPYDLSKCFFEGLKAVSEVIYGEEDVAKLLSEVDHIRYSTTQGTNAICERKGPKLGLVVNKGSSDLISRIRAQDEDLYDFFVGDRVAEVDLADMDADPSKACAVVSQLTGNGANRLVVCFDAENSSELEAKFKQIAFDTYPRHLLGAVPMMFASELIDDVSVARRAWTSLINSFLHPAMENFLYNAENRLREYRTKNPLLIFRNDGDSSRVAKTIAIKTYSSGPRGGMEGVKQFSKQYGLKNVLSMDVGGTTTDIGHVVNHAVDQQKRGEVEGVSISFPLCDIASPGAGGSSIIAVADGKITVGPESVGAVPGPASFGRGGKNSTMTDVNLLMGLLDPSTYFGGGLSLDVERARAAVLENVAVPLDVPVDDALLQMRDAYEQKISNELHKFTTIDSETALMAFGGAGPMNACGVAEKAGISKVYIPKTAAVYSAHGIGSCDIGQSYSAVLADHKQTTLTDAYAKLVERAERDMYAEGFAAGEYELTAQLVAHKGGEESVVVLEQIMMPQEMAKAEAITLEIFARKRLKSEHDDSVKIEKLNPASSSKTRSILSASKEWIDVPVYEVNFMSPGDYATGPAVVEEDFFTCLVREGWEFTVSEQGDICLIKGAE